MNIVRIFFILLAGLFLVPASHADGEQSREKKRFLVIDSYHREYNWSRDTNDGFCDAMLKLGYFDNRSQIDAFTKNDHVETSKAVLKKLWMDTKRKKRKSDMKASASTIFTIAKEFSPDLIFLGDDNAANYIGNLFLDADIPVVFWGLNNTPVKYGLLDEKQRPGHNITGVYQTGYYVESLHLLKKLVPEAKTFVVLSDKSSSGRSHLKKVAFLHRKGALPLELVETVSTGDYKEWKAKALELQKKVDAFYVVQYAGLKDRKGKYIPTTEVAEWYTSNISKPEAAMHTFVDEGLLCAAADSGYNQGHEAALIADDILSKGADPAAYPPRTPGRGPLMVNRKRAEVLGIKLSDKLGIEKYID